ncbi:MAG TPA: c-type cytochrome [Bryobacteraceae bacterium]|jgi:photosynthetic reaction center cytochrome c subunit|nr:c-type cytochrome [Bryobacteraceae bacterium]
MRFLVTMLLVVVPLCAQDAPPQKKGGGGEPKNLKVLTPAELHSGVMGKYVAALGVQQSGGCNFCHVQGDRASDEKPEKNTARMMIVMVKDINAKVAAASGGTAKEFVTCYTCHRGKTEPDTVPAAQ